VFTLSLLLTLKCMILFTDMTLNIIGQFVNTDGCICSM